MHQMSDCRWTTPLRFLQSIVKFEIYIKDDLPLEVNQLISILSSSVSASHDHTNSRSNALLALLLVNRVALGIFGQLINRPTM